MGHELGKEKLEKPGGEMKDLQIIQDCKAIYRRIEEELNLTYVPAHDSDPFWDSLPRQRPRTLLSRVR